jgi:hypothetical protein
MRLVALLIGFNLFILSGYASEFEGYEIGTLISPGPYFREDLELSYVEVKSNPSKTITVNDSPCYQTSAGYWYCVPRDLRFTSATQLSNFQSSSKKLFNSGLMELIISSNLRAIVVNPEITTPIIHYQEGLDGQQASVSEDSAIPLYIEIPLGISKEQFSAWLKKSGNKKMMDLIMESSESYHEYWTDLESETESCEDYNENAYFMGSDTSTIEVSSKDIGELQANEVLPSQTVVTYNQLLKDYQEYIDVSCEAMPGMVKVDSDDSGREISPDQCKRLEQCNLNQKKTIIDEFQKMRGDKNDFDFKSCKSPIDDEIELSGALGSPTDNIVNTCDELITKIKKIDSFKSGSATSNSRTESILPNNCLLVTGIYEELEYGKAPQFLDPTSEMGAGLIEAYGSAFISDLNLDIDLEALFSDKVFKSRVAQFGEVSVHRDLASAVLHQSGMGLGDKGYSEMVSAYFLFFGDALDPKALESGNWLTPYIDEYSN